MKNPVVPHCVELTCGSIVLTGVETGRLPENELTRELIHYRDSLKGNVSEQGEKLLGGKHIQGKLMSKVVNLLFQELCKVIPVT
ncbi:hypothetical protein [Nostoc flagelliforme]|uniref:hypothetical protein n=1 Tax=Nostoc flagelliforme TaxID=1306274 RepID=UPI001F559729|nr:hypothetical protein [Nostoc flagelliforme]